MIAFPSHDPSHANGSEWAQKFAELRQRYPRVRPAILTALHILSQNPDIGLDDAKAQAAMHGVRITAASMNAARKLLHPGSADAPGAGSRARGPRMGRPAAADAARAPQRGGIDAEQAIRDLLAQLRQQDQAEIRRLRAAIEAALDVMRAALAD
ncbi:MAG: hypothetical protein AB7O97_10525 [Planctomycetota bacterium]